MAQATFGSPIKEFKGETKALTTAAQVIAVEPGFQEVLLSCPTQWRLALTPKLKYVLYYTGAAGTYTDYTTYVTDKSSSTHLPLDAMLTTDYLYMGFANKVRGVYFNKGTNVQDVAATLDVEYGSGQQTTITGAISAAAVTCVVTSATGLPGTAFTAMIDKEIVTVSNVVGTTVTIARASGAVAHGIGATFTAMFHDVASDTDGTDVGPGDTLKQDGNYTWTLPTTWIPSFSVNNISSTYWIRFAPSDTLTNPTDINEIIPMAAVASYAYMEAGVSYQFSINTEQVGGLEVLATAGTPTLDVSWLKH
jgi:hypothetical protein